MSYIDLHFLCIYVHGEKIIIFIHSSFLFFMKTLIQVALACWSLKCME